MDEELKVLYKGELEIMIFCLQQIIEYLNGLGG